MVNSVTSTSCLAAVVLWGSLALAQTGGEPPAPTPPPPAAPPVLSSDPGVLLELAQEHFRWGEARRKERLQVFEKVNSVFLAEVTTAKSLSLARWKEFARVLGDDLTAEGRAAWATKLRTAFAPDDAALFALNATQLRDLVGTQERLRETKVAANLAWKWLKQNQGNKELSAGTMAGVAMAGLTSDLEPLADKVTRLTALDTQWQADNAKTPLGVYECDVISQMWVEALKGAKAQAWAMRGYENALGGEEARAKADPEILSGVGRLLLANGLTDPGKGYPAFAQVVARLGKEGQLKVGYVPFFSDPLGTAETRQTVRAELLDAQGSPRLEVGRVLTRAYRVCDAKEFTAWRSYVDDQVAGTDDADRKALWLVVKADVEIVVPKQAWAMRARGWLDRALATANGEPVRVRVLGELAGYFRNQGRWNEAIDMLESVKGQYTGEWLIGLLVMQQELRTGQSVAEADLVRKKASGEASRKEGLINHYREMLTRARANKQAERAAALEAEIAKLQAELNQ
jgi:hypothetical protein